MVALFALAGCGSEVGPAGAQVGGPCVDTLSCASGSYCLEGPSYPAGVCTVACNTDAECPGDSVCVAQGSGSCLLVCTVDADCGRDGYRCRTTSRHDASGSVDVCLGN